MTTQEPTTKQQVEMAICRALADKNVFMPTVQSDLAEQIDALYKPTEKREAMSDDMKFMREIWKSAHCVQDHVTVEPGEYGGWRILVNGKAEDWNWDKRVADLMADGLRYRLAKEAAKTPDEAKAVIEKVRGS